MERFVSGFIRGSLIWLGVGVAIGVAMAFWPGQALFYRAAHMHANLLGFVSMMIFGVAYHVIPRFTGNPLRSRRLAGIHLYVAHAGLALLVGGWMARGAYPLVASYPLRVGAVLSGLGAALFIYNLWGTLEPRQRPPSPGRPERSLPLAQARPGRSAQ
jgi:drug/metabolite transporter (DMT)-like permease